MLIIHFSVELLVTNLSCFIHSVCMSPVKLYHCFIQYVYHDVIQVHVVVYIPQMLIKLMNDCSLLH